MFKLFSLLSLAILILFISLSGITISELWFLYKNNNAAIVGVFTSLGAIFTVFVFYTTYKATKNAEANTKLAMKNIEISEKSLKQSFQVNRKDDFIKQFTFLFGLHDKAHEVIMNNLEKYNGKIISSDYKSLIRWNMRGTQAADMMYQNHLFSPYMRMLYQVLKYVDESFYLDENVNQDINVFDEEKKKYTSIVRSAISNDVLFFVAINGMNEREEFGKYRDMLKRFDFFEHLNTNRINENIVFDLQSYSESTFYIDNGHTKNIFFEVLNYELTPDIAKNEKIGRFYINLPVQLMIDLMRSYTRNKLVDFLIEIQKKINLKNVDEVISEYLSYKYDGEDIFYSYKLNEYNRGCNKSYYSSDYVGPVMEYKKSILAKKIENNKLSLNDFKQEFDKDLFFSSSLYENNENGNFFDVDRMYVNCLTLIRYNHGRKGCENKRNLIERMESVILNGLSGTELVKSNIVSVFKNKNGIIEIKLNEFVDDSFK